MRSSVGGWCVLSARCRGRVVVDEGVSFQEVGELVGLTEPRGVRSASYSRARQYALHGVT